MFGRGLSFLRSAMEADDSSSDSSDSHVEYQYETPEDQNIEGIFCFLAILFPIVAMYTGDS